MYPTEGEGWGGEEGSERGDEGKRARGGGARGGWVRRERGEEGARGGRREERRERNREREEEEGGKARERARERGGEREREGPPIRLSESVSSPVSPSQPLRRGLSESGPSMVVGSEASPLRFLHAKPLCFPRPSHPRRSPVTSPSLLRRLLAFRSAAPSVACCVSGAGGGPPAPAAAVG